MLRLEGFLARNGDPHQLLDPNSDPCGQTLVECFHIAPRELPIVVCPNGELLRNPSEIQLARCIGLVMPIDPDRVYDVVIIGAGPAGLAAAVYAASEGLSVLVLDCRAFGGRAGAEALAALLGKDAPALSASTIARLKEVWLDEHEHWRKRDLSAKRYVWPPPYGMTERDVCQLPR